MKSPKQWLKELDSFMHKPDCICVRCKYGVERFLLPEDILAIQNDALKKAAEVAASPVRIVPGKGSETQVNCVAAIDDLLNNNKKG